MLGKEIKGHIITEKLGDGGMSIVYKARNKSTGDFVAIKTLNEQYANNPQVYNRFINEANILKSLEHENITKIYDFIEEDGRLFLLMEYVQGYDLEYFIKNESGALAENRLYVYLSKMLKAIGYLHKNGVIHRDIKPANFIVHGDDIKLLDFGISKNVSKEIQPLNLTAINTQIGTPMYMSPEQIIGTDVDYRSDIYSIGAMLFEMITGKSPYTTNVDIRSKIIYHDFPNPQDFYPNANSTYSSYIRKATQKKQEDRFQTCEEWLVILEKYEKERIALLHPEKKQFEIIKEAKEEEAVPNLTKRISIGALILGFLILGGFGLNYYFSNSKEIDSDKQNASITIRSSIQNFYASKKYNDAKKLCDELINNGGECDLRNNIYDSLARINGLKNEIIVALQEENIKTASELLQQLKQCTNDNLDYENLEKDMNNLSLKISQDRTKNTEKAFAAKMETPKNPKTKNKNIKESNFKNESKTVLKKNISTEKKPQKSERDNGFKIIPTPAPINTENK